MNRLGARGSALSLAQAALVQAALGGAERIEIVIVRTTGDRLSSAGAPIGWKGDFTKELEEAVLEGRVDFAVHSLKDVPSAIPAGLVLAAVPLREDPSDVLLSNPARPLRELPPGARVGTSSPRRQAQLLAARPDLTIVEMRGNVDTRIRRLHEGRVDALVLARAGLARLGRLDEIAEVFSEAVLLPAVGQGALGIVARVGDSATLALLGAIDHAASHQEVLAERGFLAVLEAGCRAPVAGHARCGFGALRLTGGVFAADGSRALRGELAGPGMDAPVIGRALAEDLLARGAAALIAESGK